MKRILAVWGLALGAALSASAAVQVGLSIGNGGINGFHLAIGQYYGVPAESVAVYRNRIPDEELPVVFFIARRAHVEPAEVVRLRLSGRPWMQVALHFGLNAGDFYVETGRTDGPYGRPYGFFRGRDRRHWRRIMLEDADLVNMVNLRFLSEHYHCPPDRVVEWRGQGRKFYEFDGRAVGARQEIRDDRREERRDRRHDRRDDRREDRRDDRRDRERDDR